MADIAMRGVRKSYGRDEVVHGVDLDIRTGEFIVILGPSGCGKSTLLRMIAGLEDVTSGEILIDNTVVNGLEPRERGCAMVFQNYALYPHMTVAENIGYSLRVEGMRKALRRQKVEEVAAAVGLSDYLDRKPAALSGGQRQRVAMARAVIRAPKVFLFDEPLSNLDAGLRVRMRHEIRRIHNKIEATSIFVTHDQHEGMTLADRLIIMNKGIVEQIGTPEEVYDRPASIYVAGFIGSPAMNFIPAEVNDSASAAVLSDGTSVAVDDRVKIRPQQMLQLGLRPELLDLGPRGAGRIPVRFEFAEEMGPARLCHVSYEELMLTVLADRKINYSEGQELGIIHDPSDLHLFDAESGMRCDADLTGAGLRGCIQEEAGIVPCSEPVGQPAHTIG